MRISDWSSDVCSSDLGFPAEFFPAQFLFSRHHRLQYPAYERSVDRQGGLHRSSSKGELRRSQRFLLTRFSTIVGPSCVVATCLSPAIGSASRDEKETLTDTQSLASRGPLIFFVVGWED